MIGDSALGAFQTAAGVSAMEISLMIRTVLLAIAFVFGAWCIYGEIHRMRHHKIEEAEVASKFFRILLMVTLMVTLVFIV